MNIWVKQILKAIGIWILLVGLYFMINLFTDFNIPTISNLFGIKMVSNFSEGHSVIISSIFPNWWISIAIFVAVYVGVWHFKNKQKMD